MNTTLQPPAIVKNFKILSNLVESGKNLCFDESILLCKEGRQILLYLRFQVGNERFYINRSVIESLKNSVEKQKNPEAAEAQLFITDLMGGSYNPHRIVQRPVMLTRNIGLAEYLSEKWDSSCVYILNNEMHLIPWKEEETANRERAIRALNTALRRGNCWFTSSALASARLTKFAKLLSNLPSELCKRVHFADISARRSCMKNAKSNQALELLKDNQATEHNLSTALATASEFDLMVEVLRYSAPQENMYTVWNDAEEAEALIMKVRGLPHGREILAHTYFLELGWHGHFMQLRGLRSQTPDLIKTVLNEAVAPELKFNTDTDNTAPTEPDKQTVRSIGPQLGTHVRNMDIDELRSIIGNDAVKRELAIVFARRWDRPDILKDLLADATVLSPYCFANWFKRSQNATQNMSTEDLLNNNDYYYMLQQVIEKSPHLGNSQETMNKLNFVMFNADSAEARRRAEQILRAAIAKGANSE